MRRVKTSVVSKADLELSYSEQSTELPLVLVEPSVHVPVSCLDIYIRLRSSYHPDSRKLSAFGSLTSPNNGS